MVVRILMILKYKVVLGVCKGMKKQEGVYGLLLHIERGGVEKRDHVPHHLFTQRLHSMLHSFFAVQVNCNLAALTSLCKLGLFRKMWIWTYECDTGFLVSSKYMDMTGYMLQETCQIRC